MLKDFSFKLFSKKLEFSNLFYSILGSFLSDEKIMEKSSKISRF